MLTRLAGPAPEVGDFVDLNAGDEDDGGLAPLFGVVMGIDENGILASPPDYADPDFHPCPFTFAEILALYTETEDA